MYFAPSNRIEPTPQQDPCCAPVREDIRYSVWLKLWGNVCFNRISALTLATLERITGELSLRSLCINACWKQKP